MQNLPYQKVPDNQSLTSACMGQPSKSRCFEKFRHFIQIDGPRTDLDDTQGRLIQSSLSADPQDQSAQQQWRYHPQGTLAEWHLGYTHKLRYNAFNELIADEHSGTQFAYDRAGRLTQVKPPSAIRLSIATMDWIK